MTLATREDVQQQNAQTAVAKRSYNPLAPIGSATGLKSLLEASKASIAQALPAHITPERLIKTMLVAANRNPDILRCTTASIMETINRAAELGLDLSGTLGEAYPVPFTNKVKWTDDQGGKREDWLSQLTLIIGYRGFAKLARQSGEIKTIDADVVKENDKFIYRKGKNAVFEFEPNYRGDRGETIGAYAYVEFKDGGEQFVFMPVADIEKVRMRSKSGAAQRDSEYARKGDPIGAWESDWDEMAKKTVFRRCAKWLPLSTEKFVKAVERDDEDYEMADVLEAETTTPRPRGAAALMKRVKEQPGVAGPDGEPIHISPPIEDPEEANRIIEEKSATASLPETAAPASTTTRSSDTDDEHANEQGGGAGEEQPETIVINGIPVKRILPESARTNVAFVDGVVDIAKPKAMTMKQARAKFHEVHKPTSWDKLVPEVQDEMYAALLAGEIWS